MGSTAPNFDPNRLDQSVQVQRLLVARRLLVFPTDHASLAVSGSC